MSLPPGISSTASGLRAPVETVTVFGVEYAHLRLADGDDLYLTKYGAPFAGNLLPDNFWSDKDWFREHSTNLFGHATRSGGTGTVYRVRTKEVGGRSRDIVLKWNRMGQDIPGGQDSEGLWGAEFNSPYEEFALVMEMRNSVYGSPGRILTHKPLAVYVPAQKVELSRSGRKEYKMQAKMATHPDVELDIYRTYAVVYEWVKGIDAVEACRRGALTERQMAQLTLDVERDMRRRGFVVRDRKPHHVIVRLDHAGRVRRDRNGMVLRASIDFELLGRAPEWEEEVRGRKRRDYLVRQAHRFDSGREAAFPPHLKPVEVLGVDYVYGIAESTGGALWVVGRDASLFDYFLPERWRRTPRTKLSVTDEIYHTVTKDNVNLVWRVSRAGQLPDMDPFKGDEKRILDYGYNSPFEEVALAVELSARGIPTTYPRAVYMTGRESAVPDYLSDSSRYESHMELKTPQGAPVLRRDREYIIVWGYWNKPDEMLAEQDGEYYHAIDALRAWRQGILSQEQYIELVLKTKTRLASVGVEDLNLRGNHLLLSLDSSGQLVLDGEGDPQVRICNFELLRRM